MWALGPACQRPKYSCKPTLDQHRDTLALLDILDERVLLLSERVLVDKAGPAKVLRSQVVDRVLSDTTASKLETLHIPPLRTTEGEDVVLGENVERHGVNTLLVDDDETLGLLSRIDIDVADGILELDDLPQLVVDKAALRLDKLLTLLG